MVPKTNAVWYRGRRRTVAKLAGRLTEDDWTQPPGGAGPYTVQRQEWACLPLSEACRAGMRRWLLVRRNVDEPDGPAYYLARGPKATPSERLVLEPDADPGPGGTRDRPGDWSARLRDSPIAGTRASSRDKRETVASKVHWASEQGRLQGWYP